MRRRKKHKLKNLIILCLIIYVVFHKFYDKGLNFIYKTDYSEYVEKYAEEYNIDEKLIYAIIKNESNFNPNAVSSVGAIGLMQVMESTAEDVSKELELTNYDLYKPDDNIKIGTKYFSNLFEKYKENSLALAAYNAGFGKVDTWLSTGTIKQDGSDFENIPYKETNMYVRKILRDYEIYSNFWSVINHT